MGKRERRRSTKDFKQEAVRLTETSGRTIGQVANDLGIGLSVKEVDDGIWLTGFIDYDLGYIDLEHRTLQTIDNPFGTRLSPMS